MQEQGAGNSKDFPPGKGGPKRVPGLLGVQFFPEGRLIDLAALVAKVRGMRIDQARAPKAVMTAIRELNEMTLLAAATRLGIEGADRRFQGRLASTGHQDRPRRDGGRSKAIVAGLDGLRGLAGRDRPCGDPIARAGEILQTAFRLDVREADRQTTQTNRAAAYLQGRMRTVAQFEGALWRDAGGGAPGHPGEEGPGHGGPGFPGDPSGGEGPSEPILPPDTHLPDPPPDPGGPGGVDPGLCESIGELCMELYQEAVGALVSDPYVDLMASVDPSCLCHDYDPNQVFVGAPAQGREFPVPLPPDIRLVFRGTDITANIILPVTPHELRFRIPPNSQTGYVYLRGLFPTERAGVQHPERLCGMDMPDFPRLPGGLGVAPPALISIIYPPVFDSLTANGEPGPVVVVVESCHAIDVCWRVHLSDQAPNLSIPPCGLIEVVVRNEAGQVIKEGGSEGCVSVIDDADRTFTVEARSFANNRECGHAGPEPITLQRVARVTLTRDNPPDEEMIAGRNGNFFAEISCPAPAGGTQVHLTSSSRVSLQVPANVMVARGQTRVHVDFMTAAGHLGRVQVRATAPGHEEARLDYNLVRSPAEICRSFENATEPWARDGQPWANWGVIDQADTFLGFLPTPRLYRPTTQFEIARAVRQAEDDGQTIRALGSGWSFSEAVLPQSTAIQPAEQLVAAALRGAALAPDSSEDFVNILAAAFRGHFGYAVDTSRLDRNLQSMLPNLLRDNIDPATLFFVEAGMTINFLNTLLDSQAPPVALRTMGGASGQSIAGAISTGTHGGDFDRPPLADNVRAIYLVGAGGVHHWIEPANPITDPHKLRAVYPCLADHIHYDDDMFHSALVSIGAMGVIYAVVLDVVPQYSLLQWNKWSTWERLKADEAQRDFAGLFDGSWTGMNDFLRDPFGGAHGPNRFVQVVINPFKNEDDDGTHNCYVTNRVQLPLHSPGGVQPVTDFSGTKDQIISAIEHEIIHGVRVAAAAHFAAAVAHHEFEGSDLQVQQSLVRFCKDHNHPFALRVATDVVMQNSFPLADARGPQIDVGFKVMAPGGTTRSYPPLGGTSIEPSFSFFGSLPVANQPGLRVAVPDVITFIDSVLAAFDQRVDQDEPMLPAGYVSLRVTGRTAAFLGMQRFDRTGFVEVSLLGRPDGYALVRLVEEIARHQGGALHWGQSCGMTDFLDLEANYGNAHIDKWKAAQRALGGGTFTNIFMQRCGL